VAVRPNARLRRGQAHHLNDPTNAGGISITSHDGPAAALIDSNGDEADINLEQYERGADGHWHEVASGASGDWGTSWSPRIAAAWGRAEPHTQVEIEYLGHGQTVVESQSGWWFFIGAATDDSHAVPRPIDRNL
jgi:hypothetical protein